MFKTSVGATEVKTALHIRPGNRLEIYHFKNVVEVFIQTCCFIAQGKAFRNEIAPRDFVFRSRVEQMEIEYFVNPENWQGSV